MYVSSDDVYSCSGIDNTVVSEANVKSFIKSACGQVDSKCNTTFIDVKDKGSVSSATNDTITDSSKSFEVNEYKDYYVWIYAGTGSNKIMKVLSNTTDTLTFYDDFDTIPDTTSKYKIFYSGSDPRYDHLKLDGSGFTHLNLIHTPVLFISNLLIGGVDVTPSSIYLYNDEGKIQLSRDSEVSYFYNTVPQNIDLSYCYGNIRIPEIVYRYVTVLSALKTLSAQMGGTYNTPSSYTLPEGSVTIGQAYVNVRGTWDILQKEIIQLEQNLPVSVFVGY